METSKSASQFILKGPSDWKVWISRIRAYSRGTGVDVWDTIDPEPAAHEILTRLVEREQVGVVWVDEWAVTPVDYYDRQLGDRQLGDRQLDDALDWHPLLSRTLPDLPSAQPEPGEDLWQIKNNKK